MNLEKELQKRSNHSCELCGATENLNIYQIPPVSKTTELDKCIYTCEICKEQIEYPEKTDPNHWRCLNDSMWSEYKPIQIVAWRILNRLKSEGWPHDLLDMMYLNKEDLQWAKATLTTEDSENSIIHKDSNGVILEAGDSVVLIKDLPVKGSSMVAKRGTAVRRISLDHDNADYIEGKINGQQIVIITKYVKKI